MGTPTYNSPFAHVSIEPNIQNNNMLLSNYLSYLSCSVNSVFSNLAKAGFASFPVLSELQSKQQSAESRKRFDS